MRVKNVPVRATHFMGHREDMQQLMDDSALNKDDNVKQATKGKDINKIKWKQS